MSQIRRNKTRRAATPVVGVILPVSRFCGFSLLTCVCGYATSVFMISAVPSGLIKISVLQPLWTISTTPALSSRRQTSLPRAFRMSRISTHLLSMKSTACLTVYIDFIGSSTVSPQLQLRYHSAITQQIFICFYRRKLD
jgi:hypothetical protein